MIKNLSGKIRKATTAAFKKALQEFGKDKLTGFALYSDESATSLIAAVNTDAHLQAAIKRRPKDRLSWQWSPPEWKDEAYQGSLFEDLNNELYDNEDVNAGDDEKFEEFTDTFFKECVNALLEIRKIVPKDIHKDFVLVFDISDYEDTDQLVKWAKKMNSPAKAREFQKMMED
ncbi:MAG TPA: DUF4303 domain-containing protein [Pyrinomonadaceae bacterium]|nr:DUF4303 domain-containing protein [Pyrinomonadaceae bacterium]